MAGRSDCCIQRAKHRLSHTHVEGIDWYWPAEVDAAGNMTQASVRLLTPFDPVVWDHTASNCYGDGSTAWKLTRRPRNVYAATILYRCFGGIA